MDMGIFLHQLFQIVSRMIHVSYELSAIISHGINDMYVEQNDVFYYISLANENYNHQQRPKNLKTLILLKEHISLMKQRNQR